MVKSKFRLGTALVSMLLVAVLSLPLMVGAASPEDGPVNITGLPAGVTVTIEEIDPVFDGYAAGFIAYVEKSDTKYSGEFLMFFDIKVTGLAPGGGPYEVRVDIASVKAGDDIIVFHEIDNGGTEAILATAHDGYITFKTNSFSPFAVFQSDIPLGNAGTTSTSSKTGVYA